MLHLPASFRGRTQCSETLSARISLAPLTVEC